MSRPAGCGARPRFVIRWHPAIPRSTGTSQCRVSVKPEAGVDVGIISVVPHGAGSLLKVGNESFRSGTPKFLIRLISKAFRLCLDQRTEWQWWCHLLAASGHSHILRDSTPHFSCPWGADLLYPPADPKSLPQPPRSRFDPTTRQSPILPRLPPQRKLNWQRAEQWCMAGIDSRKNTTRTGLSTELCQNPQRLGQKAPRYTSCALSFQWDRWLATWNTHLRSLRKSIQIFLLRRGGSSPRVLMSLPNKRPPTMIECSPGCSFLSRSCSAVFLELRSTLSKDVTRGCLLVLSTGSTPVLLLRRTTTRQSPAFATAATCRSESRKIMSTVSAMQPARTAFAFCTHVGDLDRSTPWSLVNALRRSASTFSNTCV